MDKSVTNCDHKWCIEGDQWVCDWCGKSEDAQQPSYDNDAGFWRDHALGWAQMHGHIVKLLDQAEEHLARLVRHADDMEAQHEDYHNPEGPLRSQVLCEAMTFLERLRDHSPAATPATPDPLSNADES